MLTEPMLDPVGTLVVELRADADVESLVGARIRTFEPLGASDTYEGDALGPGHYKAFVVVTTLSVPIDRRVPITRPEYALTCYGTSPQNASAIWGAVVKAIHGVGARIRASNGQGIYVSWAATGGEQDKDPFTSQPLVRGTIELIATAQAVTA